jgi:TRAP-type C4-dicarboxylate transport system substrate-binding protein
LYIHLINKKWLDSMPADLQKILLDTIAEESAAARQAGVRQLEAEIACARGNGVQFHTLSDADRKALAEMTVPVYAKWEEKIGKEFLAKVRAALGN